MRDADVRAALHRHLSATHAAELSTTLFVDELGLCGEARVDVAVVNGALSGFELKSASDTLRRFPTQVQVYSRVLDHATLVVAENHAAAAEKLLPDWWGYYVATTCGNEVRLSEVRASRMNPAIEKYALAQLLWRDEALDALSARHAVQGLRSKPRTALWLRLSEVCELSDLRDEVRSRLKARSTWRAAR